MNRQEKLLRHVAMVAKFLDENKPKIHIKSKFALFKLVGLIQSHFICQMLAKFSGRNPKGQYLTLEKEKETFCVVFTYSVELARVTVVQQQLKNVQKSVMNVQSCCFAKINLLLFCRSLCRRRRSCPSSLLLWSRNFATMVTWRHTSPLYWTQAKHAV